jgi:hypothetical protein
MPQIGFFVGAAASVVGAVGVLLAWDRHDRGPGAADDIDTSDIGLYSFITPITGAQLVKAKTKSPVEIPEDGCPNLPDGFPDATFVNRLEFKPSAAGLSPIGEFSFEIFDGNTRVYGAAAPSATVRFELSDNSVLFTAVSVQDNPRLQALEDPLEGVAQIINSSLPAKELWRALMTPNQPLEFF